MAQLQSGIHKPNQLPATDNMHIERINYNGQLIATIVRDALHPPNKTTFITTNEAHQQVGFISYPANGIIPNHFHLPIERQLIGTTEVILVVRGSCIVLFFDHKKTQVNQAILNHGDLITIGDCGHGFQMLEDTVLLEVKQGPYLGPSEKERFA